MNIEKARERMNAWFNDSERFSRYFKEQYSNRTKRAQKLKETYSLRFIPKGKRFDKFFDSVEYGDKELLLFNYIAHRGKLIEQEDWVTTYQWKEYVASSSSPFRNYSFKRFTNT
jgi:hypothetical protein